jgi:anti-sigma factor RsiW
VMSSDRLEGVADVGLYEAQRQVRRRPVPARSTVLELLPQRLARAVRAGAAAILLTVAGMASHRPSAST